MIEDEDIDKILQHPVFTMEVWLSIIEHVKERIPSFFRMVDRLRQDMEQVMLLRWMTWSSTWTWRTS